MENRTLVVEGLPEDFDRVKSKVELYFKNKRRSGGEVMQIREHEEDKRKALLIYMKEEDLQKVLDRRTHRVDFKQQGTMEVTVKLPDQLKIKKTKPPPVLPKPERSPLLKSLPAQVSPVRMPAMAIKAHKGDEEDSEIPDLLITSPSSLAKETLQMYFEQFTEQPELAKHGNNSWILKLLSRSDFEEILGMEEHEFGISLQVYKEGGLAERLDPRRFILSGFDSATECNLISVFIGSCSKTTKHTWEALDEDRIVVTFKHDIDVKSFMRKCTSRQLQGRDIGVTCMEQTDSVLVQGDLEQISEDMLTLYFSNKKRSRGGEIQSFIWINRLKSAVITFGNPDDAHAVVEQEHSVCGTDVHTSLFYSSLQKALTGEKPDLTDVATKVTISVSEDLLRFFETNEQCRKQLESSAKPLHAKVHIDSGAGKMTLEMDVNKHSLAALQIAPSWASKTTREVQSLLSWYDIAELTVEKDVWSRAESGCRGLVTGDTALLFIEADSKVVIAGTKDGVKILSDKVRALVKNAAVEVEVERNTIEVTIQLDSTEIFDLITERIQSQLRQVTSSYDEKRHTISLTGLKDNVRSAETLIKHTQKNFITQQLTLSSHLTHFIKSLDLRQFEQDHFLPDRIPARLLNQNEFLEILVEKENLKRAEDKISEILKEQVIQLPPHQSDETQTNFLCNLQEEIESFPKGHDIRITQSDVQVIMCGFSNAVTSVAGKVKRFLENNEPTTENIPLKSAREAEFVESCLNLSELPELKHLGAAVLAYGTADSRCLKVTAAKDNIREAVGVIQKQLSSIVVEKHRYHKAGEAKVLEKHEPNVKTKAKEMQCCLYLSHKDAVMSGPPKSFAHKIGSQMTLNVTQGDLHHYTADALICPMNGNLDFNSPVTQRFLRFGGDKITEACKSQQKQNQCLLPGDVLISEPGKLSAETLIYVVLPQKGQAQDSHYLQLAVRNGLLKAEENGCASIALPAVGCETFGFSLRESCTAIRAAVLQFCSEKSPKNIQSIIIVDSDEKTVEEFNALIQELGFPDTSTKVLLQSCKLNQGLDRRVLINGVPIFLKKSDITKETVDVIVNSTNKSLDLNTGVSGAILKAAGKSVVNECKKQAPLKAGAVVMTGAGALRCQNIAQMVGPESITDITASLGKVLNLCEGKKAKTLAIPAIGTGRGGFEPKDSMKAILTAIEKHLKETNSSCLRRITIVTIKPIFNDIRKYFKVWNKPAFGKMPENQAKIRSVRIEVKKGNITTESVRGIVNSTNRDMSLRGGVSGAIFKAAGASVEQECQKHGPLQNDEPAVTGAGKLQCDVIFHMVGPHTALETRSRVRKVLERCEEKQITTVSFPAVGTGGGGVQAADAVTAMLQGFEDHLAQNASTVLKLIYIVIDQDNILQEFQKGLKTWTANTQDSEDEDDDYKDIGEWEDCSSTEGSSSDEEADASANPVEVMMGPVKVKVFCGDITKETVEAIVNSTTTSLDLSSGVSGAILKASGPVVLNECKAKAPQPADGVVLTTAGNLKNIKRIIHMVGQTNEKGISSSMYKVLKMCEENDIQSISFPALGTGAGKLSATGVANAMIEALSNFVKDSPKHLKCIHIVIFQKKLLPDFQEAVKKCKKISLNAPAGLVKPLQTLVTPVMTPVPKHLPPFCLAKETASVMFPTMAVEIYGTSSANLAKVKRLLDELLLEECDSKDVRSRHIADLPETDKKAIVSLSQASQISVLVMSLDHLTFSGKRDDVLIAVLKINGFIQEAREREMRGGEVKRLKETLCWEVLRGEQWEPLDPAVSYDIELAFHGKQNSFQYQESGETYTVDFNKMKLTNSKQESSRIKRSLLGDSDTAIIHPPPTWIKMDGRDLEIITLQSHSAEYKKIETDFLNSSKHPDVSPVQVQQIDRIQSQSQWQRYCVLKQAVDKKYPKQSNERLLYHGTTKDICQKINKNGFNRSFCGRNAVVHGDGTYFARDAWYSSQDRYSNPDDRGLKYIYRARVVTGSPCKSRQGMKEPDPINPADPRAGLHDCAVDSLQNPFIYVVFCDAGAYPDYLITFKTT